MAMIYGLNYLGSSLVAPTWACAPGMQTGGPIGPVLPAGKGGGKRRGSMAGASLCGGGASHTRGRGVVLPACGN